MADNLVSTVNLGCTADLKAIARHAQNAEYNPKRFAAVMMRIREPKPLLSSFHPESFNDFKIQNIVASCDLGCSLSLARHAAYLGSFSVYEPELFLGLIYRMKKPRVTILVFPSGKIVLAGARKKAEIFEAFKNIYPILMSFKKNK
ncbi:hypothetical protein REPUB_Repub13aG0042700 [Reevesia pubescens]